MKLALGKLIYGALFCVALPLLLAAWTQRLDPKLAALPRLHAPAPGVTLAALGAASGRAHV